MKKTAIPKTVWALGFVSLFMDLSSEMIHSILPVYMHTLGLTIFYIGIIEGIAEATAQIVKVFSGAISDYLGRRKVMLILGYGLSAFTKPIFPLATSINLLFTARFIDRIGKGLRGAPRDALIADVTAPEIRGASFGLRQSMDVIGAVFGPLIAFFLIYITQNEVTTVLWLATIPAFICVLILYFFVQESNSESKVFRSPIKLSALKEFSSAYWWVVIAGAIFSLGRFSEAFLTIHAFQIGGNSQYILVLFVMSLIYSLSAYPAGIISDKLPRAYLLVIALIFLIIADFCLANASSSLLLFIGVAFWGLHLGFSQGILASLIADHSKKELKGTAFGIFNLVSGIAMLIASILAGYLWDSLGSSYTFYSGAFFACCSLLVLFKKRKIFLVDFKK